MKEASEQAPRIALFHSTIAAFINERRAAKLKVANDETAGQVAEKYGYASWLAHAAYRVMQIQAVTHTLKATHPDARGSSLHVVPESLPQHTEIGTHALGNGYAVDIDGNAAARDVYKFLKLEVEGLCLLDWFQNDDADLLAALHEDSTVASDWAAAFKGLIRPAGKLASHEMAKQVYWSVSGEPTHDTGFHLLQPLFSSSLAHAVHLEINEARFGDDNKAARHAKRGKTSYKGVYRDYRNLVIRKLGGTKPLNVSQLNWDRRGVNYLLASLPPQWDQDRPRQFLHIESALERFHHFEGVNELIRALCNLLESNPERTMETRIQRERIERALGQSLVAFGLATQQLFQPGWTRDEHCDLPQCEQLWLDPERAELPLRENHEDIDTYFIEALERKDWPDEVAHRFGNWLNAILRQHGLPVGDTEHAQWARQSIIAAEWPTSMKPPPEEAQKETNHG